ncbi:MAG: MFS transporter [Anaerolineae bacterium]
MERARKRTLIGVSVGHGVHDIWLGLAPVLLAALSTQMGLSNADIGLGIMLYQGISSLTQPLFGRLTERIGARPFAVGSILWTTSCFSVALFVQTKLLLMGCIALAGLGSGAWHPQGAANASVAGGKRWGATATSIFFLGGTVGSAFPGAALGGYLLENYGRRSLLIIAVATVVLALTVIRDMIPRRIQMPEKGEKEEGAQSAGISMGTAFWILLATLLLGTALRRVVDESMGTFFAKYQQDLGVSTATYGFLMALFLAGRAIGGVVGSYLADRVGLRSSLVGSVILCAVTLFLFVNTLPPWSYLFFILSGFLCSPSQTLFMVSGQRQFPRRIAMVSGLFLGFAFLSGAGGVWVFGLLADRVGLQRLFALLPWFLVGAAVCGFIAVPSGSTETASQKEDVVTAQGSVLEQSE